MYARARVCVGRSSKELSTPVSDSVKCKETKFKYKIRYILELL